MRRTKVTLIYRHTKNLRAVQLLLGHSKLESTVRYLGIEVDDALEIAEQTEIGSVAARSPSEGTRDRAALRFARRTGPRDWLLSVRIRARLTAVVGS
jgi:hypothetical protein